MLETRAILLVVEDDLAALRQLKWTFDEFEVLTASNRQQALDHFKEIRPAVVLLDLGLPPDAEGASEGLAALHEILALAPSTKIIVVTGREEREHALRAVELGAYDFYQKPVQVDELRFLVERALRLHELEEENATSARQAEQETLPGVVAVSESMLQACRLVERAARSDISVSIIGGSGTGKELLARALHTLSARSQGPLVTINCAAIPEHLFESEFFGHERGAFTGAVKRSIGQLEVANGGTLFLDEVGDLTLAHQAKLLRFLQERLIRRVGGREEIPADVRITSATHRDLQQGVADGSFREDLYYRLCELTIEVPPLSERIEDAVVLARYFFEKFRAESERHLRGLSPAAFAAISRHDWPGNVRELKNRLKRAVLLAEKSQVTPEDLDLPLGDALDADAFNIKDEVREIEKHALIRAWAASSGNVSRASKLLGVSRPTLYKLLHEHGIKG